MNTTRRVPYNNRLTIYPNRSVHNPFHDLELKKIVKDPFLKLNLRFWVRFCLCNFKSFVWSKVITNQVESRITVNQKALEVVFSQTRPFNKIIIVSYYYENRKT